MSGSERDSGDPEAEPAARRIEAYYARLFSEVSHDLRAPLGVILGALGELEGDGMPALDAEQALLLRLVRRSATRLSLLTANLLELSRMDTGRFQLRPTEVEVTALVREAVAQVRAVEEGHPAELSVDVPLGGLSARLDGDRTTRIVTNLVSQALRFARARVEVSVAAGEGGGVHLTVGHDGTGLTPEDVQEALDPLDRTVPARAAGDLALSLAGALVRAHGGQVRAEARPGGGVRVVCTLPDQPD